MQAFTHRDGQLFAEGVALSAIAERFGTPTYVYSRAHIEAQYRAYADALQGIAATTIANITSFEREGRAVHEISVEKLA